MRTKTVIIICIVCLLGILFSGCTIYKNNSANGKKIGSLLLNLGEDIRNERWAEAQSNLSELDILWRESLWIIGFNALGSEVRKMENEISRMQVRIEEQNKEEALIELTDVKNTWENIGDQ